MQCTRRGFTLLELVVVLSLLGLGTTLVLPWLSRRAPTEPTLRDVVAAARANAIARAQSLALEVLPGADWSLRPLPPGDTIVVSSGRVSDPPARRLEVRLSALGSCVVTSDVAVAASWDVARCGATLAGAGR